MGKSFGAHARIRGGRHVAGAVLAMLAALVAPPPAKAVEKVEVRPLRVPDGGLYPQSAVDARGVLHLVFVKGDPRGADAFYVRSEDGGTAFSKPVPVNSQPKSIVIAGTVRGPHMALGRGGRVHVAWMGSSTAEPKMGKFAPMLYTRLKDDGQGFEPERNVITARPGLDGGGSVAADQDGNVYVAWHAPENHDEKEAHAKKEGHDDKKGHDKKGHGKMNSEEGRHVWVTRSTDDGKTFLPERRANKEVTGVCACCGMRIFAGEKGRVFISYRTAKAVVNRDMLLLASSDRGETFTALSTDPWKIGQCVMSTSSFAVAPSGTLLTAWETERQIRLGRVGVEAEKTPALQNAPGQGKNRKHPSLAVNKNGETLLAWTEGTGWEKGGTIAWQLFDKEGKAVQGKSGTAPGLPAWGVPAAVTFPDGSFRVIY